MSGSSGWPSLAGTAWFISGLHLTR